MLRIAEFHESGRSHNPQNKANSSCQGGHFVRQRGDGRDVERKQIAPNKCRRDKHKNPTELHQMAILWHASCR
jgi:hypothetical protein